MTEDPSDIDDEVTEIIDTIEAFKEDDEDALTPREREIEADKESERIRRAKELKKQLRKRELGILNYRWPAVILILAGIMSIWSQFLVVMVHDEGIGFDTFASAFVEFGNPFYLFPAIAGGIMIVLGFFAYNDPRVPYVSVIPAMMIAMAGGIVYYLVSFGLALDPEANLGVTNTPLSMFIVAILCLLSIAMRERE